MYNFVFWREDNLKKFLEEDGAERASKCLLKKVFVNTELWKKLKI